MKIAIDGPAGAGKSCVARALSKRLGYIYADTGALYRTVGLFAVRNGVRPSDRNAVLRLLPQIKAELKYQDGEQRVFLNGEDVSEQIRTEQISMAASDVSAMPEVREFLFALQKALADGGNVVMDGRDIGTVVMPDAEVKIFLTAAPESRAARRVLQLAQAGVTANFDDVLAEVKRRDYNDAHREASPLVRASDAVLLDSTELSEEETVAAALDIIRKAE